MIPDSVPLSADGDNLSEGGRSPDSPGEHSLVKDSQEIDVE